MSYGLMVESLVALLLLLTIGYCALLNHRLKQLRADEQTMKMTIAELVTVTESAERAVQGLRATARECEETLSDRLAAAEQFCQHFAHQMAAAETALGRRTRAEPAGPGVGHRESPHHGLASHSPVRHDTRQAPDPRAVAEAARSFADRLRARVGTLAA